MIVFDFPHFIVLCSVKCVCVVPQLEGDVRWREREREPLFFYISIIFQFVMVAQIITLIVATYKPSLKQRGFLYCVKQLESANSC